MRKLHFLLFCLFICSCGLKKNLSYSSEYITPTENFKKNKITFELDYSDENNWAFRSDLHNSKNSSLKTINLKMKKVLMFQFFTFILLLYFPLIIGMLTHFISVIITL